MPSLWVGERNAKIRDMGVPVPLSILHYFSTQDRLVRTPILDGQCVEEEEAGST